MRPISDTRIICSHGTKRNGYMPYETVLRTYRWRLAPLGVPLMSCWRVPKRPCRRARDRADKVVVKALDRAASSAIPMERFIVFSVTCLELSSWMCGGTAVPFDLWFQKSNSSKFAETLLVCVVISFVGAFGEARAASVLIVAIGADNTVGTGIGKRRGGVSQGKAFPAQLETMLHTRGLDAHVSNVGVSHDTTAGILARLDSSVPEGTRLVILNVAKGDDKHQGLIGVEAGYVNKIKTRLAARHIPIIVLPPLGQVAGAYRDFDGHHFTAEGHAHIAAYLLPKVMAIIGRSPS